MQILNMTKSQSHPPHHGAYFRVTKEIDKLKVGELLLAWTDADGEIRAMRGEQEFYYDAAAFAATNVKDLRGLPAWDYAKWRERT